MVGFLAIFLGIYLVFGFGNDFVCNFLIGFLYPAYASIMTLEFPGTNNYLSWIIYWIVYAFFGFVEYLGYHLFQSLSVYWLLKCGFLIWLMVPGTKGGAYVLYQGFIRRVILFIEKRLKNQNTTTTTSKSLKKQ
jgi:receptor expression-enhancing protein 5/6